MPLQLDQTEVRVLASLMEKSVLTPDVYPMTLNALTLACNQKSSRDPVMTLEPGTIGAALRSLEQRQLVKREENARSGIEKYAQRLTGTAFSVLKLDAAEFAVLAVLMLRGAQTPGELRTRCTRLHEFADNADVRTTLERLIAHPGGALVARLPRTPGRQDHTYMHQFHGVIESVAADVTAAADADGAGGSEGPAGSSRASRNDRLDELEARVELLEALVSRLDQRLQALAAAPPPG